MTADKGIVGAKDQKSLVFKGARFWIYKLVRDGFVTYVLTTAFRYDNWLMFENVYDDGEVVRHWRYCGYHIDFTTMNWVKDKD